MTKSTNPPKPTTNPTGNPTRKPTTPRTRAAQKQLAAESIIDVEAIEDAEDQEQLPQEVARRAEVLPAVRSITPDTLTVDDLTERLAKARDFIATALVPAKFDGKFDDRHDGDVGVIPGTGNKPVLLKGGAEKLARLFRIEVASLERTAMERIPVRVEFEDAPVDGWMMGYQCAVAGPDGMVWGRAEAFASHEEATFQEYDAVWNEQARKKERTGFKGLAAINTLAARAQKRAYVRAVVQALGISSMVSTSFGQQHAFISEAQRGIVGRIYELAVNETQGARAKRSGQRVTTNQWDAFLGAAIETAAAVLDWDEQRAHHAKTLLGADDATVEDVDAVMAVGA